MKIFLKSLKGDKAEFEVQPEDTVLSLKQQVKEAQGHEMEQQKLIFAGRIMEDAKQLAEYAIKEGDNLVVMISKPKPAPRAVPEAQPVQAPAAQVPAVPAQPSAADFEAAVQRVMELGFPRDQTEAAIRAARGNPDLAIEVLMGGGLQEEEGVEGAEGAEPEEAGGENPFSFLNGHPAMAQIRQTLQQNPTPQAFQALIGQISGSNPELAALIQAHPQEFVQFLMQPVGPQIDPRLVAALPRPGQIQLSREEVDAVKNLASLGFSDDDALEAYLSCDKNEAMAASLLFESYTPLTQQRPPPS
jgi:UV excision repair protein RAD23